MCVYFVYYVCKHYVVFADVIRVLMSFTEARRIN